ncbi:hypothetical protein GCM10025298_35270 [Natronobiforma cellulositropha]
MGRDERRQFVLTRLRKHPLVAVSRPLESPVPGHAQPFALATGEAEGGRVGARIPAAVGGLEFTVDTPAPAPPSGCRERDGDRQAVAKLDGDLDGFAPLVALAVGVNYPALTLANARV